MKRVAILLMVAVPLIFAPGVAAAKGNIPARGYAVLTGPGLSHPIVFSAPWDSSKGGYYGDEAEVFLGVANYSGATPAAKDLTQGAGSVPDGVVPLPSAPARDELGPKYRLTWFRDYLGDVAEQDVYPYARGGPVVYTFPSSRQALINIFGRFQDPAHMWTGWGQETPYGRLRDALEFNGLPSAAPTSGVVAPTIGSFTPTTGVEVPTGRRWTRPALALCVLVVLMTAALWFRRRRRQKTDVGAAPPHVLGGERGAHGVEVARQEMTVSVHRERR